jgi:hypothetical protein
MTTTRERRDYSPERKAEILAILQANNGNLYRTAALCKVPRTTIIRWLKPQPRDEQQCQQTGASAAQLRQRKRQELTDSLRSLAARLVGVVERELPRMNGRDASVALGIVCDKLAALDAAAKQDEPQDDPQMEERLKLFRERFGTAQRLAERYGIDNAVPNPNPRSLTITSADVAEAREIVAGSHPSQKPVRKEQVEPEVVVESQPEGAPMTVLKPAPPAPQKANQPWRRLFG